MFNRGKPVDYDANYPGQGTGIPYSIADVQAMVSIYDLGNKSKNISEADLKAQILKLIARLEKKVENGYYDRLEFISKPARSAMDRGREVYETGMSIYIRGHVFREYLYLTSFRSHYISIRVFHPDSYSDDIIRNAFVNSFFKLLSGS